LLQLVGKGVVSYGLSSYGYDIRVSDDVYTIFTNATIRHVIDLKRFLTSNTCCSILKEISV